MSSRQLRKLQKQRELEKAKDITTEESEGSEKDDIGSSFAPARPRVSLFAALGGDDDDDDDGDDQEDDLNDDDAVRNNDTKGSEEAVTSAAPKKNKKKKKKKSKAKAKQQMAEGTAATANDGSEEEDEIDRAMKELNIATPNSGQQTGSQHPLNPERRLNELLGINTHYLKVMNEMRIVFGRDIIESANAEEEQQQEQNRRRRGPGQQNMDLESFLRGPPDAKKLPEVSLRRNIFIQGREHWPRATVGGLMMHQMSKQEDGSSTEYAFVHDEHYDSIQSVFFSYIGFGDPMRMVYLLQRAPYHVSTLQQVSTIAKQEQNMALTAELQERALFSFGRVVTSAFKQDLETGKARLEFRRPENRQFWLAGYHYIKTLMRKGTYRTALEWSKVLFALDHDDPYSIRNLIHVLALHAYQSQWLIDFINELDSLDFRENIPYLRQSIVLAKLQLEDMEGARNELRDGMKRVPWLYCGLFQELRLDAPPSIWGINAENSPTMARPFWTKLYIHQTKDLWNSPRAISLLKEVAKSLSRIDTAPLPLDDPQPFLPVTRLMYLEENLTLMGLLPQNYLEEEPNYDFDPLPPAERDNIFSGEGCKMAWGANPRGDEVVEQHMLAHLRNILERRARAGRHAAGPEAAVAALRNFLDPETGGLAAVEFDDPDLAMDLEEHIRRGRDPGLLHALLEMLRERIEGMAVVGVGARAGVEAVPEAVDIIEGGDEWEQLLQSLAVEGEQLGGLVPGAWPEDDENDD